MRHMFFRCVVIVVTAMALTSCDDPETTSQFDMPNINRSAADFMTGGQPSLSDLVALKDEGFRTIIDLRVPGEFTDFDEAKEVEALGMTYANLPISMGQGFSEDSAKSFDALLERADKPVLIHCGSSARVGALFALRAHYVQGASVEAALEMGENTGIARLKPMIKELMSAPSE